VSGVYDPPYPIPQGPKDDGNAVPEVLTAPLTLPAPLNVDGNASFEGSVQISSASNVSSGTGAPAIAGAVGDYFFRTDATGTADERIYVCTVAGAAGAATWAGIV
jgi:hypothetical protein